MKLSLRTFLLLVTFAVIAVSLLVHWNTPYPVPMSYAVIDATERISDNYPPPTEMIMWRNPWLYRSLRKTAASELPLSDEELLQSFLADPKTYIWYNEKHKGIVRENREAVLSGTQQWLGSADKTQLFNVARMRAMHDDRQAYDLLRKTALKNLDPRFANSMQAFPDQWWHNDLELRDAMPQMMLKVGRRNRDSILYALKVAGDKQPWIDHYLAATSSAVPSERFFAIQRLTEDELSERTFAIVEGVLSNKKAAQREEDLAQLLARFFKAENPELRKKAFAMCERLSYPDKEVKSYAESYLHQRGQNNLFYQQLCFHGGEEYIDYFVRFAKEHRFDCAMRALVRLWPKDKALEFAKQHQHDAIVAELLGRDALPYLRERLREEPSVGLAQLIVNNAEGQPELESAAALESLLANLDDGYASAYYNGREVLNMMQKLGRENVDELRSKLPKPLPIAIAQDTSFHWIVHDIDQQQFVAFLNTSQVGKTIQLDDVYQQIEKNGMSRDVFELNNLFGTRPTRIGYDAREFAFNALEAAGVAHECYRTEEGSSYLGELLALINKHSVGVSVLRAKAAHDHRIWLAPKYTPPKMQVTFDWRTIELNIFDDQTHPILIAEALNNMLDQFTDYEHRFYAYIYYPDGWDEHYIAYLKPAVAAKLEKDFGLIPFPPH